MCDTHGSDPGGAGVAHGEDQNTVAEGIDGTFQPLTHSRCQFRLHQALEYALLHAHTVIEQQIGNPLPAPVIGDVVTDKISQEGASSERFSSSVEGA